MKAAWLVVRKSRGARRGGVRPGLQSNNTQAPSSRITGWKSHIIYRLYFKHPDLFVFFSDAHCIPIYNNSKLRDGTEVSSLQKSSIEGFVNEYSQHLSLYSQ